MPFPKPNKNEKQNGFISRCVANDNMNKEFKDQKQRLAVCYSLFKRKDESVIELNQKLEDKLSKESLKGYKIVGWDEENKRAFSIYDTKLDVDIKLNSITQYKTGLYLGTSKNYVLDYFSGGTDFEDLLLTYEYDKNDLIKGDPYSKNGEIVVKKAKLVNVEKVEE